MGRPAYRITVTAASRSGIRAASLRRAVKVALRHHSVASARIDLAVVSDAQIAALNEAHLEHVGPTDVLTFDLRDSAHEPEIEGQIVMSIDTARREAANRRHPLGAELALYAVHGTLHLLGYDDRTRAQAAAMHKLEDQLLAQLGLGAVYHPSRHTG